MREKYRDYVIGVVVSFLILGLLVGGYFGYTVYQQHQALWGWAGGTQQWINETDAQVEELKVRLDKLESLSQTETEKSEGEGE